MVDEEKRLRELCELASKENDPEKMMHFVNELNQLFEAKENHLLEQCKTAAAKSAD